MKPWDEMSQRERLEQTFIDLKRKQLHREKKAKEKSKALEIEMGSAKTKKLKKEGVD